MTLKELQDTTLHFFAIDNHTHPLLKSLHRDNSMFPFEGIGSEAQGSGLTRDAVHSVPFLRMRRQLNQLYALQADASWETLKETRDKLNYEQLCRLSFKNLNIQTLLLDDGLDAEAYAEDIAWHDQFVISPCKRVVRLEIEAEKTMINVLSGQFTRLGMNSDTKTVLDSFTKELKSHLQLLGTDPSVAGFKSIACYRTGLDVSTSNDETEVLTSISLLVDDFKRKQGRIRLAHKPLNDFILRICLTIAAVVDKPVQFHTGLGDNDIKLRLSSPSHLQPTIEAFPKTKFVLLHSSYPYTRDAGYLTAVYENVYLDFGEIFPFISAHAQRDILHQVFDLCPTNKIMWSTDGHWWPESYYLGTIQARQALFEVLSEYVHNDELSESQAVRIVQGALFHNANRIYKLHLTPGKST